MATAKPPTLPAGGNKPPDNLSGSRRPAETTSSLNHKNAKETTQVKKHPRAINLVQEGIRMEDSQRGEEMETEEIENTPENPHTSAWAGGGGRKLFGEGRQKEGWYIAESDTEDTLQAEKEDDDECDGMEHNPNCPTIPFTAAENIRWRREWRSALVVKGLGRRVPFLPLSQRMNSLWGKHGELKISDMKNGCFLVRFRHQDDYEAAINEGPWLLGDTYLTVTR
ncbi:unnamed protein product [Linum trigynum]|uniref:DUF4283 domain-containing protein n=1 Tax=Linum trigynum TaxID=586398 RepID=A0AAV2CA69_9ROSI